MERAAIERRLIVDATVERTWTRVVVTEVLHDWEHERYDAIGLPV